MKRVLHKPSIGLATFLALGSSAWHLSAWALDSTMRRATVEMPASVPSTAGQPLTLGRVANITSNDLHLLRQLMGAAIATSATADAEVTLATKHVESDEVVRVARKALSEWMRTRGMNVYVELAVEPREMSSPTGEITLRVRPLTESQLHARRLTVWTEVWLNGTFHRALPTTFELHPSAQRVVVQNELSMTDPALSSTASPTGAKLPSEPSASPLKPSLPLDAKNSLSPSPIRRGQSVVVSSSVGNMTIETKAQALQDGTAGQTIQVKFGTRNDLAHARVVGPGHLELVK